MSPSNERSAEFWRGVIWFADHCSSPDLMSQYRTLLAAAEAREATQPTALPSVNMGGTVMAGNTTDAPTAADVIEAAAKALEPFATGGVIYCLSREDYSVMRERIVDWHGPSDFRAAAAAADLCARWKEANGGK